MRCPQSIQIASYLDEELNGHDKASMEAHLAGCAACAISLERTRALRAAFSATERHQAPVGFSARVIARTAALKPPATDWRVGRLWDWLTPLPVRFAEAAVLLLVISVGILAGRIMTVGSPSPKTAIVASAFSLDLFDATPPGSLGGAYLAMTEARHEK